MLVPDDNNTRRQSHERVARLTVVNGPANFVIDLPRTGTLTLGRSSSADITIDDDSLSRVHGQLECGEMLRYLDLGSSNGSWVGGRAVAAHERVDVGDGEVLELGSVVLAVQWPRLAEADATDPMAPVRQRAARAAKTRINVLLLGETGVGKGMLAREIHAASDRAAAPFVVIDCAALAVDVVESELFGHEAGAFTGASRAKPGLIEAAEGGTAFLDEIGELPLAVQAKLLRVIEERAVRRVGGVAERTVDVRFIAATHRDLQAEAAQGRFRGDLLYRLNAVSLEIPPLRRRRREIEGLARGFLREMGAADAITGDAVRWLEAQPWPGNVRELRNAVERAAAIMEGERIEVADLASTPSPGLASGEVDERARIIEALDRCAGNQTKAAELLGISRRTLIHRLDLYRLPRPRKRR